MPILSPTLVSSSIYEFPSQQFCSLHYANWSFVCSFQVTPLVKLLTGGSARAHTRLILTFAASSVLTYIAVPNSCYQSYFEMRNRRSRRWKERSSLPTIGSAKRWEVVGKVFGTVIGIVFQLCISFYPFSSWSSVCIGLVNLYLRVNCRDITLAWVLHGNHSFLRKPSSDISTSPPSSGHSSDFQFYGPSLILYSSATWETTTRPCVSPHHMSLQSKLAQWLTYWATSVPVVLKEACSSCSPRVAVQHCLSSVMRLV